MWYVGQTQYNILAYQKDSNSVQRIYLEYEVFELLVLMLIAHFGSKTTVLYNKG